MAQVRAIQGKKDMARVMYAKLMEYVDRVINQLYQTPPGSWRSTLRGTGLPRKSISSVLPLQPLTLTRTRRPLTARKTGPRRRTRSRTRSNRTRRSSGSVRSAPSTTPSRAGPASRPATRSSSAQSTSPSTSRTRPRSALTRRSALSVSPGYTRGAHVPTPTSSAPTRMGMMCVGSLTTKPSTGDLLLHTQVGHQKQDQTGQVPRNGLHH